MRSAIREKRPAGARDLDAFDERERRVSRDVQQEVPVHVRHVGHATLARQADRAPRRARHLDVVDASTAVDLRGRDGLVRDQAGLVEHVVGAVAGRVVQRRAEVERLAGAEQHRAPGDVDVPASGGDQRQPGRMRVLGEEVRRDRERRDRARRAHALVGVLARERPGHRLGRGRRARHGRATRRARWQRSCGADARRCMAGERTPSRGIRARHLEGVGVEGLVERCVVARVVGQARGRVRAERSLHDCGDELPRDDRGATHVLQRAPRNDLLDGCDHRLRSRDHRRIHGQGACELEVPILVRALRVDEQDVQRERRGADDVAPIQGIGGDPGKARPLEDVRAERHLARHRRKSPAGRLERLCHRERVHLVDLDPSLLERGAEARRETEQVEAREAEDGLADGPGLQQELERQPAAPADVGEVARPGADHRIDQRQGNAGEERAAHAEHRARSHELAGNGEVDERGTARGPRGSFTIVGHEPATAAW